MNEYQINFINEQGVYQQLTFRGVSEGVAFALAKGLLDASFDQVSLSAQEFVERTIDIVPGAVAPVSDNTETEGASGASGASGATGAASGTGASGSSGASEPDLGGTGEEEVPE